MTDETNAENSPNGSGSRQEPVVKSFSEGSTEKVTCPDCESKGEFFAFQNMGDMPHKAGFLPCVRCCGTGKIRATELNWITFGQALRARRLRSQKTIGDLADELGIGSADYSKIERGLVDGELDLKRIALSI